MENEEEQLPSPPLILVLNSFKGLGVKLGVAEGPHVSGQLGICCDLLSQKHKRNKTEAKGFSIAAPESVSLGGGQEQLPDD